MLLSFNYTTTKEKQQVFLLTAKVSCFYCSQALHVNINLSFIDKFILTNRKIYAMLTINQKKGYDHMYKKSATHYISKAVIDVLFVLSIISTLGVPFFAKNLFNWIGYENDHYGVYFSVVLFLSGGCCTYILFNLKQMFKSLLVGNPFTDKNVSHFRKMAIACVIIAVIYIIKAIIMFTFATIVIATVFVVGTLFCLTLKDLFKQAINYKTENELTI